MKSQFFKRFNHNKLANDYDNDIAKETNPIRSGYKNLINWVAENTKDSNKLLDLGCGTGNTTLGINENVELVCIDVSEKMIQKAKTKFKNRKNVEFIEQDLLNYVFQLEESSFDTIVSTYAIHHLTQKEKHLLFEKSYYGLTKNGKILFGDLMFQNAKHEVLMRKKYPNLIPDFDDEFFWNLEEETNKLLSIGFKTEIYQFSDLSYAIIGVK